MQFTIETSLNEEVRKNIEDYVASSRESIIDLIRNWISPNRSLVLIDGQDDVTGDKQLYLLFEEDRVTQAEVFVSMAEVEACFGDLDPITPPPIEEGERIHSASSQDDYFERREKLLEAVWEEGLCSNVYSFENAVKIGAAYARMGRGEITFSAVDEELWEIQEEDSISFEPGELVEVHGVQSNEGGSLKMMDWFFGVR